MPLFRLGRIVMTPKAIEAFEEALDEPWRYINLHCCAYWGLVPESDWQANDTALLEGLRIISVYEIGSGERIWIITEADRSSTCILLPGEY